MPGVFSCELWCGTILTFGFSIRGLLINTILKEHQAADIPFLESLVATPTMRAHLGDVAKKIAHLFHPPPTKPPETAASKPEPPPEPPLPASISELRARAEEVSLTDPLPKKSVPERLNPVFKGNLDHYTKGDLDAWRDVIHNHLLNSQPTGTKPINLLWIDDRVELERVFPSYPFGRHSDGDKIAKFVSEIRVHPEIKVGYDFRSENDVWFVHLAPAKRWESTTQALQDLCDQPGLEVRYGISPDAASLLEWIETLREKDYLGKWTPIVEDQLEKKIGIKCPWNKDNFSAYLTELLTELNERTPYELTLQPWKDYSESKHRIRVSRKKSDESVLIQQIQLLALKHGKTVPAERIREWLSRLLE